MQIKMEIGVLKNHAELEVNIATHFKPRRVELGTEQVTSCQYLITHTPISFFLLLFHCPFIQSFLS